MYDKIEFFVCSINLDFYILQITIKLQKKPLGRKIVKKMKKN